jgi:hypothetical protein
MTLRLVLVGIVAALGVSIPSQPSSEHWFESAEAWATSLLAEWDTWEPTDGDGSVPTGKRGHLDCEECRLAGLRLASNAIRAAAGNPPAPNSEPGTSATTITASSGDSMPTSASQVFVDWVKPTVPTISVDPPTESNASVAFEPIRVTEPFDTGIAYELNRSSEGLIDTSNTLPDLVAATTDSESALPAEAIELDMWGELYLIAAEPVEVAKPLIVQRSDDEPVSCLDEEWAYAGCLDEAQAASDEPPALADLPWNVFAPALRPVPGPDLRKPGFIPAIGSLAYLANATAVARPATPRKPFTGALPAIGNLAYVCRQVASISSPASPTLSSIHAPESARLVDLPRHVFAPVPAVLAQEPLHSDGALVGRESQPARLGDAVELTRRAVSAWVSVLIGPALVNVSRR